VNSPGPPPDNVVYSFCNTSVMIDLYDHPITVPGSSLRFYEHFNPDPAPSTQGWMYLDWIQIEVCPDAGCSSAYTIFLWGDNLPNNNLSGSLATISPETQEYAIYGSKVGILINMNGVPNGIYQFVRVSSPTNPSTPNDCGSNPNHSAQLDALYVE
jgi:hypothetical protein